MRPMKMKNAFLKTRLLLAAMVAVAFAHGDGSCCCSWHHRPNLQPDCATGLPHPARRPGDLLVGLRLQRRPGRLCARGDHEHILHHHAGSRPDADRHRRTDGHRHSDEQSSHRGRQHIDSVSRVSR